MVEDNIRLDAREYQRPGERTLVPADALLISPVDQQLQSMIHAMAVFSPLDAAMLNQTIPAHELHASVLVANRLG